MIQSGILLPGKERVMKGYHAPPSSCATVVMLEKRPPNYAIFILFKRPNYAKRVAIDITAHRTLLESPNYAKIVTVSIIP